MSQPRVFEFAKEIGMETLTLMDKIKEWNLPVKSHMATLSDDMIEEIKTRLEESAEASKKSKKKSAKKKTAKKKTTKKKASSKKTTSKKTATKKKATTKKKAAKKTTTTKKTASKKKASKTTSVKKASKVVTNKTAAAKQTPEEEPQAPRRLVIRRSKNSEEEGDGTPDNVKIMKAEDLKSAQSANAQPQTSPEDKKEAKKASAASEVEGKEDKQDSKEKSSEGEVKKTSRKTLITKKNIIGRMDLSRVKGLQKQDSSSPAKPRQVTTRARNLRTGFVAPEPMVPNATDDHRKKEDYNKKKKQGENAPKSGQEQPAAFKSADFRKREAVFQPKKKRNATEPGKKTEITTPAAHKRVVKVHGTMTVNQLANEMGVKVAQITRSLMNQGEMVRPTTELDFDTISLIVPEFNWEAQNTMQTSENYEGSVAFGNLDAQKVSRPPVVTVMGHVDHGKTTLLDSIRSANVVKGEAGGITQHIGAYRVSLDGDKLITFIDTPGHEAFTSMRERGANVTDVAIIVVAADDGMMPQTQEAVNHAKAAGVPIIIAVNKMDKEGANPEKIKQQLTEFELIPEEWGGTTIFNEISALKGDGVKELLENIHLVAEMQDLKSNPQQSGTGVVIESSMQRGRGTVATLLVKEGTVRTGDFVCAGQVVGKIRQMTNDQGKAVKEAEPGVPVEITGLPTTPLAGDRFDICESESKAQDLADLRAEEAQKKESTEKEVGKNMSLDALFTKVKMGDVKELPLVVKSDVAGSIEAIKGLLNKIESDEVKVKFVHTAVGAISESDVLLASTSGGIILGFNVRPDSSAASMAKEKGVEIKCYQVIYEMVDEVKQAMSGLLSPDIIEKEQGKAEVRDIFSIPKIGAIAGSFITEGKINRNDEVRLVREGKVVYTGKLSSLKRFKDDAKEVSQGFECGIGIENFNDIKTGDVIEAFTKEEVAREI